MLTFQLETWREFFQEAKPLMQLHWEEIALDKKSIKLSLDEEKYQTMSDSGILHVLGVRFDDVLVGYYIAFLLPHVHYKEAGLMAFTDIYFLLPECRKANNGALLFIEAEKSLKAKGVTKAYLSTKVHKDNSILFEKLGWTLSDKSFTKILNEVV